MKCVLSCFVLFVFVWSASGAGAAELKAAAAADTTPPGKSYVFKKSADTPREIELYFPPNHDPAHAKVPGLILFHGGGWTHGERTQFRPFCQYLASRGLVAATADYRMLSATEAKQLPKGESLKRVCITDAKSAIRWFKQHAQELGIDPARLIVGGGSAGGHIAVLATNNPNLDDPADPKEFDTSVAAYLLFNPAFAPGDASDAEVDVLRFLKPTLAPAVVFFGTKDTWKRGWDTMYEKLKATGNTGVELWLAEGRAHGFYIKEKPWPSVALIAADRFLTKLGFISGEPTLAMPASGEKLLRGK